MLNEFELLIPKTLDEALELYDELGNKCKILAGGTDILVSMHGGHSFYPLLLDIKNIDELKGVTYTPEEGLTIGALTTHRFIETHEVIKKVYPALYEGASQVGCVQTRHRGTIGGNICNAAPSGDTLGPLLTLNASVVVQSIRGRRTIPFSELFIGAKKTSLNIGEILIQIHVPAPAPQSSSSYTKFTRRKAMDLALLGSAVDITCSHDGNKCKDVRVSLTTAAPTVIRATKTEEFLMGKDLTDDVLKEAGEIASLEAKPRSSWRSSEEYRRDIIKAIVPKTIASAVKRVREGEDL